MLNLNTNNKSEINPEDLICRIEQSESEEPFAIFNAQFDEQSGAMIMKVNLNRAVSEHSSFFKKFANILLVNDIHNYIMDFSDTVFLDSTFLGSIINFFKQVKAKKGKLSIVIDYSKIPILSEVFDISSINVFMSLKEAKNNIKYKKGN